MLYTALVFVVEGENPPNSFSFPPNIASTQKPFQKLHLLLESLKPNSQLSFEFQQEVSNQQVQRPLTILKLILLWNVVDGV